VINGRLRSAAGTVVKLEGTDEANGPWTKTVACEEHVGDWSEPIGNYPAMPVECETRRDDDGIGYVRLNVFAPVVMKTVRPFVRETPAQGGLVIDLRGNPGGLSAVAQGISGWLLAEERSLGTMRLRKGQLNFVAYPQEGAFLGPVAILIDGQSASTSEILAAGLRDLGRARLFGEHSAGAALPSAFRALPTGDLLQFAVADMQTPKGESLEGRGVEPDERVTRTAEDLRAGRDAPLEAAKAWLRRARQDRAELPGKSHS
jgi:carboxyl-terminal processing protease